MFLFKKDLEEGSKKKNIDLIALEQAAMDTLTAHVNVAFSFKFLIDNTTYALYYVSA